MRTVYCSSPGEQLDDITKWNNYPTRGRPSSLGRSCLGRGNKFVSRQISALDALVRPSPFFRFFPRGPAPFPFFRGRRERATRSFFRVPSPVPPFSPPISTFFPFFLFFVIRAKRFARHFFLIFSPVFCTRRRSPNPSSPALLSPIFALIFRLIGDSGETRAATIGSCTGPASRSSPILRANLS